jgi:two-component system, OmpR family, phosphate regulon response regulator OmpR
MTSEPRFHLYVVEDDPSLRDMLQTYFEKSGLSVTTMTNAEDMLHRLHRLRPDLIILDVGLPGMSGLQACQKLRSEGDRIPIILLTALGEEIDRVVGLEMGADDYLGKPFSARELMARVSAVLRRTNVSPGAPLAARREVVIGEYRFFPLSRSLHRGGEVRVLNTIEYALLAELTTNPNVVVSRERLLSVSHKRADSVTLRAIDAAVMRLRKVIEPDPLTPRYIQTVRGHGYMFIPAWAEQSVEPLRQSS